MKEQEKISIDNLFFSFLRLGLTAFGGPAMIAYIRRYCVERRKWLDNESFSNGIALGQVTPGPIVITATFIGYLLYGIPGGITATIGIFTPSFLMLVGTVPYFDRLRQSPYFMRAVGGILCSFVGLLASVTIQFAQVVHWNILYILLSIAAFICLFFKVDIIIVVLVGTIISVLIRYL